MFKHTQTIRRKIGDESLSGFDHFVGLALKGLKETKNKIKTEGNIFSPA